eukprot:PhF_6_TR21229/c0_g1_i1/m.30679
MKSVEIPTIQTYTIPYKKPTVIHGNISKRQIASLPNFTAILYSAEQDAIFAGQGNGAVVRWNMGRELNTEFDKFTLIGKHEGGVTCIVEHQQKYVFTGSSDCSIRVWDVGKHTEYEFRCIQRICAHDATVTALASHCNVIISVSCDCTLKLWKAAEGRDGLAVPWYVAKQMFVFETWATCLYAPLKKLTEDSQGDIFVGDANGGVTILKSIARHLDADTFVVTRLELVKHTPNVRPQGILKVLPVSALNVVMTLSYDDTVRLSDITTNHILVSILNPNAGIRFADLCWNAHQEELLLTDQSGNVMLWDSKTNRMLGNGNAHLVPSQLQYLTNNRALIGCADAVLVVEIQRCVPTTRQCVHDSRIVAVSKIPTTTGEKDVIATVGADNHIFLWQAEEKLIPLFHFKPKSKKESEVASFCFFPRSEILITGHDSGSLKFRSRHVHDATVIKAHTNTVTAICVSNYSFTKSGECVSVPHVASVSFDGSLAVWEVIVVPNYDHLWSVKPGERVRVSNSELLSICVDDLKKVYIIGGNEGDITFWSIKDLTCVKTLRGPHENMQNVFNAHQEGVTNLVLDGNILFSAGEDERIMMWDTISGGLIHCNDGYSSDVSQFFVLPENGNLVSCLRDGTVHVWSQSARQDVCVHETGVELTSIHCMREPQDVVMVGTEQGEIIRINLPLGETARGKGSGLSRGKAQHMTIEEEEDIPEENNATAMYEEGDEELASPGKFSVGSIQEELLM